MIEFRKLAKRGNNVDKRKTIIVWMDGKKAKITKNKEDKQVAREQAATKEDSGEVEPIPTYIRQNTLENEKKKSFKKGKKQKSKTYKQIFISAISAILLGVGLGLFMLNMFADIDNSSVGGKVDPLTEKTTSGSAVASDVSTYMVEGLEAFVLQAGLFNEKSSLKVVQDKFSQAGLLTMVWEKDNQFYLFANIDGTKDLADPKKARYEAFGLDTFAKEWRTNEAEIKLTKAEYEWLQNFHALFITSLKVVSDNKAIPTSDWNKWIESYPGSGETTAPFYKKVKSLQSNIKEVNETTAPIVLLKLWNQFANTIVN